MSENKLYFTEDHEWVKVEGDIGYIGITDYAQGELGDVIFVELPSVDDNFNKKDAFKLISIFLETKFEGGRHLRRIKKI